MNGRALLLAIPCECAPFTCNLVWFHSLQDLGRWVPDERCRSPPGDVVYAVRHYESVCTPRACVDASITTFRSYPQCESWTFLAGSASGLIITLGGLRVL